MYNRYGFVDHKTNSALNNVNNKFKVYLITMDQIDEYWDNVNRGASDMAKIAGIHYIWTAPEVKDTNRQIELIHQAVKARADLIMIAANDPIAISNAVEDAKSQGVKIIYVDAPAYEEAIVTLATDNYNAGRTAAEIMINELEALGIRKGSIGIIGVNNQTLTTMDREFGFRTVMKEDGRFHVLPTIYTEGDPVISLEATRNLILQSSDLVGIFGVNEGTTTGVGNGIKESNKRIIGIGFDPTEQNLELLKEGYLKAIMAQNPYTMGYLGMAEAIAALLGYETGPILIDTGISIVTA